MIDGLKLIMPGDELRARLDEQIRWHQSRIEHYERELQEGIDAGTNGHPRLPDHVLERERDGHLDRVDVLTLIRDHVVASEIYRLSEADLHFGELIPQLESGC